MVCRTHDLTVQTEGKVTFDGHGAEPWIQCLLISPGSGSHFLSQIFTSARLYAKR